MNKAGCLGNGIGSRLVVTHGKGWWESLMIAALVTGLGGCARVDSGPERYQVSGKVMFDGQPVPHGSVVFDPDVTAGNNGPQGAAAIIDGVYDTSRDGGRGIIGGAMIVTISGLKNPHALEGEDPGLLFSDYSLKKDFAKEMSVLDFNIPKAADQKTPGMKP